MVQPQTVAAAGPVAIARRIVWVQVVIGGVVDAAQAQGRAVLVGLCAVVVDHIEQHLQPGRVQSADHSAQLAARAAAGLATPEARGRCTPGNRVVAPVIAQLQLEQAQLIGAARQGHQADGGHPHSF